MVRDSMSPWAKSIRACTAVLVVALLGASAASAGPRPLSDFLDTQGTPTGFTPVDYFGWISAAASPPMRVGIVDYAGVANRWLVANGHASLGTSFSGTINERALPDGRAEVSVNLHTDGALTWVYDIGGSFEFPDEFNCTTCPMLFGHPETEVLAGATPSLGSANFRIRFINTAPGAPLPDVFNAFVLGNAGPGQELLSVNFESSARGTLSDGSPGMASIHQTGLFTTGFRGAVADGFPDERVEVGPIGGTAVQAELSSAAASEVPSTASGVKRSSWGRIKSLYR